MISPGVTKLHTRFLSATQLEHSVKKTYTLEVTGLKMESPGVQFHLCMMNAEVYILLVAEK